ncbi:MAG: hypothetical protein U0892_21345 [Pirellulales bacterium]
MNGLHFAIAAVPLAMYLLLMGSVHLRAKPLVTTGWRDMAALGIAVLGLVAIGPMQLFFPTYAGARFPGLVWIALIVLYGLCLLLIILNCRPKLIVYGIAESDFYLSTLNAAKRVDPSSHWEGQILNLPGLGMQLVEESTGSRTTFQITGVGGLQSIQTWMAFEQAVVEECRCVSGVRHPGWAGVLVGGGSVLAVISLAAILVAPELALEDLKEFILR